MNSDLMMSDRDRRRIRLWAKCKYLWLDQREYCHDWWCAYNDEWDVNIYTNEDDEVVVCAYPMSRIGYNLFETDYSNWVALGVIAKINNKEDN